jgi:hypothetical protein
MSDKERMMYELSGKDWLFLISLIVVGGKLLTILFG